SPCRTSACSGRSLHPYGFQDRPQTAPRFHARAARDSSPSRCRACRDRKPIPPRAFGRRMKRAAGSLRAERGYLSERNMGRGTFSSEFITSDKKKKGEPSGSPFSFRASCLEHVAPVDVHVEPFAAFAVVRIGENAALAA